MAFAVSAVFAFVSLNALAPNLARDVPTGVSRSITAPELGITYGSATDLVVLMDEVPESERTSWVRGVGSAWARQNARAAMAYSDQLPEAVRADFIEGVAGEWALMDPTGFLAFAASQGSVDGLRKGLANALIVQPEQVLEFVAGNPSVRLTADRTLEEAAIAAVTERDPAAALAYLDTLASSDRYTQLRGLIAETWARQNPGDALAWAEGLQPSAPGVVATVIAHTAETDIDAALDLLEFFDAPANHPAVRAGVATPQAIARTIVRQIPSNLERERIAARLLHRRTANSLVALGELTAHWAQQDPAAAMAWAAQAADRAPPGLLTGMARQLAATDAASAASFADRLPLELRLSVAREIAPALARRDPFAAVMWLEPFQEYANYRRLLNDTLNAAAETNPASAAAAVFDLDSSVGWGGEVFSIMESWVARDLAGATAWVEGIANPERSAVAAAALARHWLQVDAKGAQRWILQLPSDEVRKPTQGSFIHWAALLGHELESSFVRAYGDETEDQVEISGWVLQMARERNPHKARSLAREWISDPEIQRQTEETIEAIINRYALVVPD